MSNIKMHVDNWTYHDFNLFLQAAQDGDMVAQYELVEKLLIGWDYEAPFEEGLMALGVAEGAEVLRTVFETISGLAEDLDTSDVVVDMSAWSTRRFLDFNQAREQANHRKVEKMLHEVATLAKVSPKKPLKFQDGAVMMKAVTDHYRKLISGKN